MNTKNLFLKAYNKKMPKWKNINSLQLIEDRSLDKILDSIVKFIEVNKLEPKRLVDSVVDYYLEKNKRYPNIFCFKNKLSLNIYKNYNLAFNIDLDKLQKIRVSVIKSKNLLKNMSLLGIINSEGLNSLLYSRKGDPFFLLAHGFRKEIDPEKVKEWDNNEEIRKLVLDEINS